MLLDISLDFLINLSSKVKWHLFKFAGKWNLPGLAALLFRCCLKHNSKEKLSSRHSVKLLLLNKPVFFEDIQACFGSDDRFDLYRMDGIRDKALKAMASAFLPPFIDDNNYLSTDSDVEKAKQGYREFLSRFWQKLQHNIRFDAVLTGNFSYYAEREFAHALELLGTPFIVLHKESLKSPGRIDFFTDVYKRRRGPFNGRKILVYNEIERQVQINSGVVAADRIQVVGMPRLDRIHQWRLNQVRSDTDTLSVRERQVLFFFFGPKTGLPRLARKTGYSLTEEEETVYQWTKGLAWLNLYKRTLEALVKLAVDNPDIKVIIKIKGRSVEEDPLQKVLGDMSNLPERLIITSEGDVFQYIVNSQVVCGFNTTGLLEAIAAGKPVVVPWFDEANDQRGRPYIIELGETVNYADSPNDLIEKLAYFARQSQEPESTVLQEKQHQILDYWTGNPDGNATERARRAVLREVM